MNMRFWNDVLSQVAELDRVDDVARKAREQIRAGTPTVVRIDCFDAEEEERLGRWMRERHPDIQFFTTKPDFERARKEMERLRNGSATVD